MPQDAGLPDPSSPLSMPGPRDAQPIAGRINPKLMPIPGGPSDPQAPPGLSATPDVMALLAGLRQRWISAVLLGGTLAVITGLAAWFLLSPKHVAFAQIQVRYVDPHIMSSVHGNAGDFKTYLKTTAEEMRAPKVIASALRRDEVKRLGLDQKETDPVQAILEDLKVEWKENSELVTIQFPHHDPAVALTLVNGIKGAYLEDIVNAKRNERAGKITELEKVNADAVETIKTKKERLKQIVEGLGTVDPRTWQIQRLELTTELKDTKQQSAQVGLELIRARAALETLDARIKAYKDRTAGITTGGTGTEKEAKQAFAIALEEELSKDALAKDIRTRIRGLEGRIRDYVEVRGLDPDRCSTVVAVRSQLKAEYDELTQRKRELTPRVKQNLAKAAASPMTSTGEDPAIMRAQLEKQVNSLVALDAKLTAEVQRLSTLAARTPVLGPEYDQLAEEIKTSETYQKEIFVQLERERVEGRALPRIRNFQDAELMKKEVKKQILAASVSPIAVFGAVCMGLSWLEFRKRRVRSAGEISRGLGIRVVGAVPRMPHLERHLVNATGESDLEGTPVMESIDAIRTRLLHEANTRSTRIVMVTSAGPGEGKTTLASALATSLARAGRKTLLLDGDLRRPTVHELFEVAMQPGFSEVLLGEIEVAEAAQETPQENLSVIPAGQWDREVLLALSRDGLEAIFERLSHEFDFVVVDSHPVLSATDSLLIGRQADAVLLSVLREVSQMPRVYAASQQLSAVGIRVLGAVVNGTSPEEVYTSPPATAAVA